MAKNDVSVSNNFYKAVAKGAYMRESIKRKRQNKEFREKKNNAKRQKTFENIEAARKYEKKTFHKGKASNPEHIREVNNSTEPFKESYAEISTLTQTEICQGQGSIRHAMPKVIQSFQDKITHGPEYICTSCDQLWSRSSVSKCKGIKYSDKYPQGLYEECINGTKSVNSTERICSTCLT